MIDPTFFPSLVRFSLTSSLLAFPLAAQSAWDQARDLALEQSGTSDLVALQDQGQARILFVDGGEQNGKCCDHECKADSGRREIRIRNNAQNEHGNTGLHWISQGQGDQPHDLFFGGDDESHAAHDSHGKNESQEVEVRVKFIGPDGEEHEFGGEQGGTWQGLFENVSSGHGAQMHRILSDGDHEALFFGRDGNASGPHFERRVMIGDSEEGPHEVHGIRVPHLESSPTKRIRSWTSDDGKQTFVFKVDTDESETHHEGGNVERRVIRSRAFAPHALQAPHAPHAPHAPKATEGGCACCGCSNNPPKAHSSRARFGGRNGGGQIGHWTSSSDAGQTIEIEVEADGEGNEGANCTAPGDHPQVERSFTFDVSDADGGQLPQAFTFEVDDNGLFNSDGQVFELRGNAFHTSDGDSEHETVELLAPGQTSFIISGDGLSNGNFTLDLPDFESMDLEEILEWAEDQNGSTEIELNSLPAPAPKPEKPAPNAEQASQKIIIV